jgi:hypothetical protein
MEQPALTAILPLKIRQLADIIIEQQKLGVEDALQYLYSSDVYRLLTTGALYWTYSAQSLYDLLREEKRAKKRAIEHSPELLLFYSFCLENYKNKKHLNGEEALAVFIRYKVIEYLQSVYDTLHTQGDAYIQKEIERYIQHKKRSNGTISRVAVDGEKA